MDPTIKIGPLIARTLLALLGGLLCSVFWVLWLSGAAIRNEVWLLIGAVLLGPVSIAAGLAAGSIVYDRLVTKRRPPFGSVYLWPLAGASFAGAMTRSSGPFVMLLGMLFLGAAALVIREIILARNSRPS